MVPAGTAAPDTGPAAVDAPAVTGRVGAAVTAACPAATMLAAAAVAVGTGAAEEGRGGGTVGPPGPGGYASARRRCWVGSRGVAAASSSAW